MVFSFTFGLAVCVIYRIILIHGYIFNPYFYTIEYFSIHTHTHTQDGSDTNIIDIFLVLFNRYHSPMFDIQYKEEK